MNDSIKVLQLNCLHLEQHLRREAIAEAIKHAAPAIGMLQEVNDSKAMMDCLRSVGYEHFRTTVAMNPGDQRQSALLFSQTPWVELYSTVSETPPRTAVGVTLINDVKVLALATHSPWGGDAEGQRLQHHEAIDRIAADAIARDGVELTILGADLNAEPSYRSIRYLLGRDVASDNISSTLWTDAWTVAGDATNEITVSAASNELAADVARSTGAIAPEIVPDRRIDYILTRGWNYGRRGGFTSFERLAHPEGKALSDHYGIIASIQL